MFKIPANPSGTRSFEVKQENLETIEKYALFRNLIDSNGIIDEEILERLRFNARSILQSQNIIDKELLYLCIDLIYHPYMKPYGLHQLTLLYIKWKNQKNTTSHTSD